MQCYRNLVQSPDFQAIIQSFDPCDCDPPWRDEVAPARPSGKVSGVSDYGKWPFPGLKKYLIAPRSHSPS